MDPIDDAMHAPARAVRRPQAHVAEQAAECALLEVFRAERDGLVMSGGGSFTLEVNVGPQGQVSLGKVRVERTPKRWREAR